MAIYLGFKKTFKHADVTSKQQAAQAAAHGEKVVELTKEQTKQRITALVLVFVVVIFFWMSFHQNGLTLTWFARDYTANSAEGLTRIGFSLPMMTCIVIAMYSLFSIFQSTTKKGEIHLGRYLRPNDCTVHHPLHEPQSQYTYRAAALPAVQPLLRGTADAHLGSALRSPRQERQGTFDSEEKSVWVC